MIKNGQIVLRALAMTEIQQQQTGDYLKNLILDVVKGYNLTPEQIYSITTDNGANMLKCVRLLVAEQENQSGFYDVKTKVLKTNVVKTRS